MLLTVFSDTHGNTDGMLAAVAEHRPDMALHLGDHSRDADLLRAEFPDLPVVSVRGNCDILSDAPEKEILQLEGLRLFLCHGHEYSVKFTLDSLLNAVHFSGAKLGLFGHTHIAEYRNYGDLALLNPGSAGKGERSYGLLTIEGGKWEWKLAYL